MKKFTTSLQKGFTLVELLVVIAVLGVLATVVIIAIDPLEQLARGDDAGRVSTISQVGNAMQAYATSVGGGAYPTGANEATWLTTITTAGELKTNVSVKATTPSCSIAGNNYMSGMCYESNGAEAIVWTLLGSKSSKAKAQCTANQRAVAAWIASKGQAGVGCVNTATTQPTSNTVLY